MSDSSGKETLLEGIAEESRREVEKIMSDAERQAGEIVGGAKKKAEKILEDAEERGNAQAEAIREKNRSTIETERKKIRLSAEERLLNKAHERIRTKLAELKRSEEYPRILRGWIVEAALGLSVEEAVVNTSTEERPLIGDDLLHEAEKELRSYGVETKLSLADGPPISGQGVVLNERGGRLSFNNKVEARLQRAGTRIRRMIYDTIHEEPE